MGSANCRSLVTPKSSTMKGTAFEGSDEPSVLLMTDMMPPTNTSIFFLVGQLLGCSGSSDKKEMICFDPRRSDCTVDSGSRSAPRPSSSPPPGKVSCDVGIRSSGTPS